MLTIKKINDLTEVRAYLEKEGIDHVIGQEQFMGMYAGDELMGIGSICLSDLKVYMDFLYVSEDDFGLLHGLAKSLLNMADLSGIKTVYGKCPSLTELYKLLRFASENDEFVLNLDGYFTVGNEDHCL